MLLNALQIKDFGFFIGKILVPCTGLGLIYITEL